MRTRIQAQAAHPWQPVKIHNNLVCSFGPKKIGYRQSATKTVMHFEASSQLFVPPPSSDQPILFQILVAAVGTVIMSCAMVNIELAPGFFEQTTITFDLVLGKSFSASLKPLNSWSSWLSARENIYGKTGTMEEIRPGAADRRQGSFRWVELRSRGRWVTASVEQTDGEAGLLLCCGVD